MSPLPPVVGAQAIVGRGDIVLCDVRWYLDGRSGYEAYLAGHVPGAIWVDLDAHLSGTGAPALGRHPLPSAQEFAATLGGLGIGAGDPVVAYDDLNGTAAGRLVWMLRVLGHDAALLDGGWGSWRGAFETAAHARTACDCPVRAWPRWAFADIDAASTAGTSSRDVLIDARQRDRYRGEAEPVDPRAGHIPGAVNVPASDNLGADGRFADPRALRARYEAEGVQVRAAPDATSAAAPASDSAVDTAANNAVVYCGSGVSACMDALAMELAGLGRPRLYVGSWSQWSRTERPFAVC
ncbi:sulfurtransferase [Candidatus Poriferisodalis sp.]|uniref:sulfurtransferase n=1 Tax=Candidatus Poriferisodalis sp. TaxID=3101277 RepID=UPI003B01B364